MVVTDLINLIYNGNVKELTNEEQIEQLKKFFEDKTHKKTNCIEWYRTIPFINELIKIPIEFTDFLYTATFYNDIEVQSDSLFMLKNTNIQHNADFIKLLALVCSLWGIDWKSEFKFNAVGSANNSMHKSIDLFEEKHPEIKIDRYRKHSNLQYFVLNSNCYVDNNYYGRLKNYTESSIVTALVY